MFLYSVYLFSGFSQFFVSLKIKNQSVQVVSLHIHSVSQHLSVS